MHNRFGLFLKTPDSTSSLYHSGVLAAKAQKLEVNAARAVHDMDSVHVNAPLMTVVDVPYADPTSRATNVQRVMVQARVPVDD